MPIPVCDASRGAKFGLALALTLLLSTSLVFDARAEPWDVDRFVGLQAEANAAFQAGRYTQAVELYTGLESMLVDALAAGDIPAEQREPAQAALPAIRYQLGRSQQLDGACELALASFEAVDAADPGLRAKLDTRRVETRLCLAGLALSARDAEAAADQVDAIETVGLGAVGDDATEALGQDPREQLDADRKAARELLALLREQIFDLRAAELEAAVEQRRCAPARATLTAVEADVPASRSSSVVRLRALSDGCVEGETAIVDAGVSEDAPDRDDGISVGVWVLGGVGLALLAADAGLEGYMASQVDAWEAADASCRSQRVDCDEALALGDEITDARTASIALLAVGGASTLAAVTWLIVDLTAGDDEPARATSVYLTPLPGGAVVGATWPLSW